MSSLDQSKYISDLVVLKTKEFKEVKELLFASEIVSADSLVVKDARSISEITNALTEAQASRFIDVLIATDEPSRGRAYSNKRVAQASSLIEDIKKTISGWNF